MGRGWLELRWVRPIWFMAWLMVEGCRKMTYDWEMKHEKMTHGGILGSYYCLTIGKHSIQRFQMEQLTCS